MAEKKIEMKNLSAKIGKKLAKQTKGGKGAAPARLGGGKHPEPPGAPKKAPHTLVP